MRYLKMYLALLSMADVLAVSCLLALLIFRSSDLEGSELLNIDLLEARVNGRRIDEMTLADITDLLGRPSVIWNKSSDSSGIDIYYHDLGLVFNVKHLKDDKEQHCMEVHIYLSRAWDRATSKFFLPYSGQLSRNLNGNWKIDRVKAEFSGFDVKDYANDEMMKKFSGLKDVLGSGEDKYNHIMTTSRTDFYTDTTGIIIVYEPSTKFIEWIDVWPRQPKGTHNAEADKEAPGGGSPVPTWKEPDEFRGLKFGQDLRKFLQPGPPNWDGKSRCYIKLGKHAELVGDHFVLYNFGPIGGVWIAASATQIQNKLVNISLQFQSKDFEQLLKIFIEKYGSPTHQGEKEVTNALGTRFRERTAWWEGKRLTILMDERSHKLDQGFVQYSTADENSLSIREQEEQDKKGLKKGVRDLGR